MSELVYLSFFPSWKGLGGIGQRTIILLYQTKIKVNCSNQFLSAYSKLEDAGEKRSFFWLFSLAIDGLCSWQLKEADMWAGIWKSKGRMWLSPVLIQHVRKAGSSIQKAMADPIRVTLCLLLQHFPGVCLRLPSFLGTRWLSWCHPSLH